ncbi:hypothetical protein MiSe_30520 [Microseira wollei NIES-4236]|uniref:Transposase n=1 Tax=Microseira wollei NIES-4236 TaxID=2530354 RepID=A0AAV3XAC8_9CYAN|nr:hypothetical protein MiSe_30520 [Microseira wollei NIES-4236]
MLLFYYMYNYLAKSTKFYLASFLTAENPDARTDVLSITREKHGVTRKLSVFSTGF